jgi:transcriptional regulator with XRE-family HTH domain
MLAGVSVEYYTRLERGNLNGVSESVLESLAKALGLDEAEHAHLFDLARAAGTSNRPSRRPAPARVRPSIQRVLDALTTPAYARNARMDILAANSLCLAPLHRHLHARDAAGEPRSLVVPRPAVQRLLRRMGHRHRRRGRRPPRRGRPNPLDRNLSDLIGELAQHSRNRTRYRAVRAPVCRSDAITTGQGPRGRSSRGPAPGPSGRSRPHRRGRAGVLTPGR